MKRSSRIRVEDTIQKRNKYIVYSVSLIVILLAVTLGIAMYSNYIDENVQNSTMSLEEMAKIIEEDTNVDTSIITDDVASASSSIGSSIDEADDDLDEDIEEEEEVEEIENNEIIIEEESVVEESTDNNTYVEEEENIITEEIVELNFIMPVDGEIIKGFAKDTLIYSVTLEEWTTHLGIDIAAEKTSVVKSSEAGTIKSIKNDPRYGLTVVIEHNSGYETVYSNLLTSEFIVEGEVVEQNQSIGTVGNTASFESLDESHLHFELWENGVAVDPTRIY